MDKGFTLLERMLAVVIITLFIAIAVPKYLELSNRARMSACKTSLVNIRAALQLQYYKARIQGADAWPTLEDVQDNASNNGCTIMENGDLPDNPFSTGPRRDAVAGVTQRPHPSDTFGAWAYNPRTGEFWANTKSGNKEEDF